MPFLRSLLVVLLVASFSHAQERGVKSVSQEVLAAGIEAAAEIREPDASESARANERGQRSLAALAALGEGNELWRSGEIQQSSVSYQRAVDLDPSFYSAQFNLGLTLLHTEQYDRAVLAFTQALRLRGQSAPAWQDLGFAHFRLKHYEKAVEAFQEAQRLVPDDAGTQSNLGFAYLFLHRHQEAITVFHTALQLDPQFSPAINGLCSAQALAKKPGTVQACTKAAAVYPDSAVPQYFLGIAYMDRGDPEKAQGALESAARIEPRSPRIHVALGFACLQLQKYRDALKHFENATTLNEKTPDALTGLGITYARLKDYEKAEGALRQALSLDSDEAAASFNLGIVCLVRGNRDCALSQYNRLKRMDHSLAKPLFTAMFRDRVLDASKYEKP